MERPDLADSSLCHTPVRRPDADPDARDRKQRRSGERWRIELNTVNAKVVEHAPMARSSIAAAIRVKPLPRWSAWVLDHLCELPPADEASTWKGIAQLVRDAPVVDEDLRVIK